jgi:hypothetical protein
VIVGIAEYFDAPAHRFVANIHPRPDFIGAVDHGLAPRRRDPLDSFSVTQPPNVRPICRDRIEPLGEVIGVGHSGLILKDKSDMKIPQHASKLGVEPFLISASPQRTCSLAEAF